jgi:hypothetical protein
MVIYCISDFEFRGATLPIPAIHSFQSVLRASLRRLAELVRKLLVDLGPS